MSRCKVTVKVSDIKQEYDPKRRVTTQEPSEYTVQVVVIKTGEVLGAAVFTPEDYKRLYIPMHDKHFSGINMRDFDYDHDLYAAFVDEVIELVGYGGIERTLLESERNE